MSTQSPLDELPQTVPAHARVLRRQQLAIRCGSLRKIVVGSKIACTPREGCRSQVHNFPAGTPDWNLAMQTVKSPGRIRHRLAEGARMDHDKEGLLRAIDDPRLKDARSCPFAASGNSACALAL